jgi:hypothetical protein
VIYLFSVLLGLAFVRPMSMTDSTLAATHNGAAVTAQGHGHAANESVRAQVDRTYGRLPLSFEPNDGQTDAQVDFVARGQGYALFLTAGGGATFVLTRGGPASPATAPCGPARAIGAPRPAHPSPPGCLEPPATAPSPQAVLRLTPSGATTVTRGHGEDPLPGKVHYLTGSNPAAWRSNVATYERVRYAEAYPGIDLVFYGNQSRLEYDFVVKAGADPDAIALQFDGADDLEVDQDGSLVVAVDGERVVQQAPVIYQERAGGRDPVAGGYALRGDGRVGFTLEPYDVHRELVIDPVLVYSTVLGGGSFDWGTGIAVDATGAAYVTGYTLSSDFPTTSGAFNTSHAGPSPYDAFVTKLSADGSALAYSTYLGGAGYDSPDGIAVDALGAAYVTGTTESSDFPTTSGAFDTALSGFRDAFVTKLSADGTSLSYSTYLGGSIADGFPGIGFDSGRAIAVDATGAAYVTGFTTSSDFPTTSGAFGISNGGVYDASSGTGAYDAFVTKLSTDGSGLAYSTYLGGAGDDPAYGIAVDALGAAYVTGYTTSSDFPTTSGAFDTSKAGYYDAFVAKLSADGTWLSYSTYLGGSWDDFGTGIAVDALGAAYVTGTAFSSDFPTTNGAFDTSHAGPSPYDAFVTKLSADGSSLAYSTYLGGGGDEDVRGIAVDAAGAAYITGTTFSSDFPTTRDAFDTALGGDSDAFVTKLSADFTSLSYSTYLGGSSGDSFPAIGYDSGNGIAVDSSGAAYVTGDTYSSDFPTTSGAFDETYNTRVDAFVAKIAIRPATASELAADLVAFVDTSIAAGTLVGLGPGAPAPNRLSVVRHHIASASAFVAEGKSAPACSHLIDAYRKIDGTAHAFAGGPAAAETRNRIIALRATLGCR